MRKSPKRRNISGDERWPLDDKNTLPSVVLCKLLSRIISHLHKKSSTENFDEFRWQTIQHPNYIIKCLMETWPQNESRKSLFKQKNRTLHPSVDHFEKRSICPCIKDSLRVEMREPNFLRSRLGKTTTSAENNSFLFACNLMR